DLHEVNKRVFEALIKCGAMDCLGERAQLLASLDMVVDRAQQVQRERASGQVSLFGDADAFGDAVEVQLVRGIPAADDKSRLAWEREYLGIYLSDHPLRRIEAEMHARTDTRCIEVTSDLEGLQVRVGGVVKEVRRRPDRSGKTMAFMELEDLTGSVSVTIFGRLYERVAHLLQPDRVVLLKGKVDNRRRGGADGGEAEVAGLLADQLWAFEDEDPEEGWARTQVVHITVPGGIAVGVLTELDALLAGNAGADAVVLHVEDGDRCWDMDLLGRRVSHSAELMNAVELALGDGAYRADVVRKKAPERGKWIPRAIAAPEDAPSADLAPVR
ncbi:MAG: OB-fold nucleic acid binding domain-containing protein, partial [Candidatus Dormibacteria bacterium]